MKLHWITLSVLTLVAAQSPQSPTTKSGQVGVIIEHGSQFVYNSPLPPGQPLLVRLNENLDTRKSKAGDRVTAQVIRPLARSGEEFKKSVLLGHLTEVRAFSKNGSPASLGIVFDQIKSADGSSKEFRGMIQALGTHTGPGTNLATKKRMCYPLDDGSTYQDCFDLPETTELTAETVGIFDLDDSLDALQLLQQQVVESRRRDFKLRAGTRMVVRANAPGPNPSAPPSK